MARREMLRLATLRRATAGIGWPLSCCVYPVQPKGGSLMFNDANVKPMLPVSDLAAAERFYEKTLGLERVGGMPEVATTYKSGETMLNVCKSDYAGTNQGPAAVWEVDDVEKTAKDLKDKGVKLESYDMPEMEKKGD